MTTYVLRRVLLMIPTLFGISFVVWLVMALSPGRMGEKGGTMGQATEELSKDPTKLAQENEGERIFRRQFGLDRPAFLNFWYGLDADDLREQIEIAQYEPPPDVKIVDGKPVKIVPPPEPKYTIEERRAAKYQLEDYGYFAVPALVDLLQKTEGIEQTQVRYWLGRSANRQVVKQYGKQLSEEEVDRQLAWTKENRELSKWTWEPGAADDARAPIVAKWKAWHEENRERWEYSGWEKFKITLTDTQFGTYWGRLIQGKLGYSHVHKRPVGDLIVERMRYSLSLNLVALVLMYMLAVPLGVFTAVKQSTLWDRSISIFVFMLYSLPNFFVGTVMIQWFAAGEPFSLFPTGGFESENAANLSTLAHLKNIFWHITLPLICLTYGGLAFLSRYSRAGMLDVIRSDYVRTARAKGLSGFTVVMKHVVRNGILPIVTLLGGALPVLIGGSVAIEYVFNINGMGMLMINSIFQKDFNVVMGVQIIVGILTMIGILVADIAYGILDPRISLS